MTLASLTEGFFVEFAAAGVLGILGFLWGKYGERRRQIGKFYAAIAPVLKTISEVGTAERVPASQVQRIVREISLSFSQAYLGGPGLLPLRKDLYRPHGEAKTCRICHDQVTMSKDACAHCNLDCCVWDFEKVHTNTSAVPEIRQ